MRQHCCALTAATTQDSGPATFDSIVSFNSFVSFIYQDSDRFPGLAGHFFRRDRRSGAHPQRHAKGLTGPGTCSYPAPASKSQQREETAVRACTSAFAKPFANARSMPPSGPAPGVQPTSSGPVERAPNAVPAPATCAIALPMRSPMNVRLSRRFSRPTDPRSPALSSGPFLRPSGSAGSSARPPSRSDRSRSRGNRCALRRPRGC